MRQEGFHKEEVNKQMKLLPHRHYRLKMRTQGYEYCGHCFDPRVRELTEQEAGEYGGAVDGTAPTHALFFRDVERLRVYVGTVERDDAECLVFALGDGKEYQLQPFVA